MDFLPHFLGYFQPDDIMYKNFNFDWFSTFSVRGYPTENVKNWSKSKDLRRSLRIILRGTILETLSFYDYPLYFRLCFFSFLNEFSHVLETLKFYKLSLYSEDFKFLRFFLFTAYWRFYFLRSFPCHWGL